MKESFKKKLVRSKLTWRVMEKCEMKHWQREHLPRKWKEKGGEEDQEWNVIRERIGHCW